MTHPIDDMSDMSTEASDTNKPGLLTILILLLLLIAMLTSLVWPLLPRLRVRHQLLPTPTSLFLQEA